MKTKINILPENLVNKIAAGEVVERPASVVKELLENSIDADARHIDISIESGGIKLIKISDDGHGMSPDEAKLALTRHATSKISSVDDLFTISTLGFRGEALPSIASVSMFELVTRSEDSSDGIQIKLEGGEEMSAKPHGAPVGTTIEVRELFFNLPARRKFLKTITTETRQVLQTVISLALAHPAIGFKLISDGRTIFVVHPVSSLAQRVSDVYGDNLFKRFLTFEESTGPVRVSGFISRPEDAKRHRMEARFFVNRRAISSRLVHAALMSGYGELLPKGSYPQGVLYLEVAPELVDVNVSPTKSEVRFKDERSLYHTLHHAVSDAVHDSAVIPEVDADSESADARDYVDRAKAAVQNFVRSHDAGAEEASRQRTMPLDVKPRVESSRPDPFAGSTVGTDSEGASAQVAGKGRVDSIRQASHDYRPASSKPYHLVGFSDLYIVALSPEAIFVIDQHAAHERVLYEQALAAFDKAQLVSQKLLFPVNVEFDAVTFQLAESTAEKFASLGFEVKPFGARSIAIYAAPAVVRSANPERLYRSMLEDLEGVESEGERIHKKVAQSFACRAAIKAGDRLDEQEMAALVNDLFACANPYVCPHGRPTMIRLPKAELEKRFGR